MVQQRTDGRFLRDMLVALQLIDDLQAALTSVGLDQVRVDVISSALPAGAATLAEQQTQTTSLQLIDDLRNALASVATDDLRTRLLLPSTVPLTAPVNGQTTVAVAGTRVQLPTAAGVAASIKALPSNTGNIFLGDAAVASANGHVLAAGDAVNVAIDNLNRFWIDAAVNGEGVSHLVVS